MIRVTEATKPRVCTFADVAVGELFRALRNDLVRSGATPRIVNNNGVYAKVASTIAVDVGNNNKDCVFSLKMPCRLIGRSVDVTELQTFLIANQGNLE